MSINWYAQLVQRWTVNIPHNYEPRKYQLPLLRAMDNGMKRAIHVWHRRCGKEKTDINLMAKKMFERVGTYYYVFPTYKQGNRILWKGMDKEGFKFMDHLPKELRVKTNHQEMFVEMLNGSTFQIIGSNDIDSIVGANPVGVVFSEYSLQDPKAWDYMRP